MRDLEQRKLRKIHRKTFRNVSNDFGRQHVDHCWPPREGGHNQTDSMLAVPVLLTVYAQVSLLFVRIALVIRKGEHSSQSISRIRATTWSAEPTHSRLGPRSWRPRTSVENKFPIEDDPIRYENGERLFGYTCYAKQRLAQKRWHQSRGT